jgi:hypothetical protein
MENDGKHPGDHASRVPRLLHTPCPRCPPRISQPDRCENRRRPPSRAPPPLGILELAPPRMLQLADEPVDRPAPRGPCILRPPRILEHAQPRPCSSCCCTPSLRRRRRRSTPSPRRLFFVVGAYRRGRPAAVDQLQHHHRDPNRGRGGGWLLWGVGSCCKGRTWMLASVVADAPVDGCRGYQHVNAGGANTSPETSPKKLVATVLP